MANAVGPVTREEALDAAAELNASIAYQNRLIKRYHDALEQITLMDPFGLRGDDLGRAAGVARTALAGGVKASEPFPYDRTFQAIAAATKIWANGSGIAISVEAFKKAWAAYGVTACVCDNGHRPTNSDCPVNANGATNGEGGTDGR